MHGHGFRACALPSASDLYFGSTITVASFSINRAWQNYKDQMLRKISADHLVLAARSPRALGETR